MTVMSMSEYIQNRKQTFILSGRKGSHLISLHGITEVYGHTRNRTVDSLYLKMLKTIYNIDKETKTFMFEPLHRSKLE